MSRVDELVDDVLAWFNTEKDQDQTDTATAKLFGALAISIGQLAAAVEQLKAGLPPASAATAALGDLPDLREMKVYVHDLQCQEPTGCSPGHTIAWKADLTVRTLLTRLAAHRREHHPAGTLDGASA